MLTATGNRTILVYVFGTHWFSIFNMPNYCAVRAAGTFDELLQQGGHFAQLIAQFQSEAEEQEKEQEKPEVEAPVEVHSSSNSSNDPNSSEMDNVRKANGSSANGTAPKVSFAGGSTAHPQPLQVQFSVEEQEARDRAASTGSNRRHSSAANAKPAVQKPSTDKSKLMTEEESASGAHLYCIIDYTV